MPSPAATVRRLLTKRERAIGDSSSSSDRPFASDIRSSRIGRRKIRLSSTSPAVPCRHVLSSHFYICLPNHHLSIPTCAPVRDTRRLPTSSVSSTKARSQSGRGKTRRGCVSQALRLAPKLTTNAAPSLVSVFCVSCTGSTKYLRHRVGRGTFGLVDGRIVRFLCSAPRWTCARNRRVYGDLLSTSHQHRPSVTPILGWRTSSIWVAHTSRANH